MVDAEYFLKNYRIQINIDEIKLLFLDRSGHVINKQISGDILQPMGGVQEGKSTRGPDGSTGITSLAKLFPWYEI